MNDPCDLFGPDQANGAGTSATCPVCHKRVRIVNPPGGDGTARVFIRHPQAPDPRCNGSRREVSW